MQNIIYLVLGGFLGIISALIFRSIKKKPLQIRKNKLTELEGRLQDLENKVSQNVREINSLKSVTQDQESQIINCLEYLFKMTDFKTDVQLQTHIVASDRFRKHFAQLMDSKKDNNTTDDNLEKVK